MEEGRVITRGLATVFISIFLVGVGFSIIMPVLPYYATSFGATAFQLGALLTIFAVCQFIFAPFWGSYSDRIGRKPVLLLGVAGISITQFMLAGANCLLMLYIARIIGGILSCATIPTALAYVADSTSNEKRASTMGLIGASIGIGMVFGPAIGGLMYKLSISAPFLFSGFLALGNLLAVLLLVPESLAEEKRKKETKVVRGSMVAGLKTSIAIFFVVMLLCSIAESAHNGTLALFGEAKLGLGPRDIGWAFSAGGLMAFITQGVIAGKLINRLGEERTAGIGMSILTIGFLLILQVTSLVGVMGCMALFTGGIGLIRPSINVAVSRRTAMQQGKTMGILAGYDSLGRSIGPLLGGFLLDRGVNYAYYSATLFSSVALICMLVYIIRTAYANKRLNQATTD
ncbi:MAG: MFS transporter [Syntrophomonadaceae bacterium]|nr:MFS transporter [Syntrophomonadaceae bacterium]